MIIRNYLGLDMTAGALRAVVLRRKGRGVLLTGGRLVSLPPGWLAPSMREPNAIAPQRLTEAIREVLDPLAAREDRISLSLPDSAGRLLLTEVETPFKSRAEGVEILKWQLKNSLPVDAREVRIDYQVLGKGETGRQRLVVALMAEKVLLQYEDLLAGAGYNAAIIDFHCCNIYNYYRPRIESGEDFILLGIERGALSLQYFQARRLTFHRVREVEPMPERIFQELNRSLVSCQENFPGFRRAAVCLHTDWEEPAALQEAVGSAFEREVAPLHPHLEDLVAPGAQLPTRDLRGMVAAVGAAERMM